MDEQRLPFAPADDGELDTFDGLMEGEDEALALETPSLRAGKDPGPCLYLGDAGERCGRKALEDGFCVRHRHGGMAEGIVTPSRAIAASITIIVLLWPYVADLVREIVRWMASH